ncbi:MAG: magnesium transporter [Zavarzinella sp.]
MLNPLFVPEVRKMIVDENDKGMKAFVEMLHPSTVVAVLSDNQFSEEDVWKVLKNTEFPKQAAIFEYFPVEKQVELARGVGQSHLAKVIEVMSSDDRVDLLRRLDPQAMEAIVRLVDEAERRDIANLFRYQENTVGSIMTTDYALLHLGITAGYAIDRLRLQAPDKETIYYIYILQENTRKLLGILPLRSLVLAGRFTPIKDIVDTGDLVALRPDDDQTVAASKLAEYDLVAIPVVDDQRRLVGIVTHDDVIDVITDEATEDMQKQAAVGTLTGDFTQTSFFTVWRKRAFWLSLLFVGELATFSVMAEFEEPLTAVVALSFFVPLCISTGGNSGSQAASLTTRALALGFIRFGDWKKILTRELTMGLVLGLTLGLMGLLRGATTSDDVRSARKELKESFEVLVPKEVTLNKGAEIQIPTGSRILASDPSHANAYIGLPSGQQFLEEPSHVEGFRKYIFPEGCSLRSETANRWLFALVIAQSVAFVCIWGTVLGSMLPLVFSKFGIDPAFASGPFVATFVDVTGILIYFSIASAYLL